MATKPTLVATYEGGAGSIGASANWNVDNDGASRATTSFSVLANDILVVMAAADDSQFSFAAAGPSGGSLTWTSQENIGGTNFARAQAWTATVDTGKSMTVTLVNDGSSGSRAWGFIVYHFRGSDGIGAAESTSVASTAPSRAITTLAATSAIAYLSADWSATDGTSRTWRTINSITPTAANGKEKIYFRDAARYVVYSGYWDDAGTAAAKTSGLTAPSGQNASMIAIEVKGAALTTYTLAAAAGSYAMSGVAATPKHGWKPAAASGAYAMTGTAATPTKATPTKTLTADAGSYTMTGTAATLTKAGGVASLPVFRAVAATSYASRNGNTTVSKPTGTVDGDIMVAALFMGANLLTDIVLDGVPSGWTQIGTTTVSAGSGFNGRFWVYWKRASSEGSSYVFLHNNTLSTQAAICSYSSCIASGSPVDVFSQNAGSSTTATGTGVTTTGANTKLIYPSHNWDLGPISPPSGMTERQDSIVYMADEDRATAGATSNRTQTLASNNPWQAYLVAIKGAAGGSTYTMMAAGGSYAMTGTAATLTHLSRLAAASSSYAMTGTAATPTKLAQRSLDAAAGSYAMTGADATTLHGWKSAAATGSYAMTGTAATLTKSSAGGAFPVFRAVASTSYAQRSGTTTLDKPTGTVDGDIMVMTFFAGRAILGDLIINAVPAGWTQIGTETTVVNVDANFYGRLLVYWKRAASEPATYDFEHINTLSTQGSIVSYSGCIASGNPIDVFSQNFATGTTSGVATGTGIAPSVSGTKLVYTGHNWDLGPISPPTGMTERADSIVYTADEDRSVSGATGDRTQTLISTNPWQAYLVALKPQPAAPSAFAPPPFNPAAFLPFLVR